MTRPNDPIAERACAELEGSAEALDAATVSQLRRARARALEQLDEPERARAGWWLTAGALAATAIVAAVLLWPLQPGRDGVAPALEDLELLAADDQFELLEELEFYGWLEDSGASG